MRTTRRVVVAVIMDTPELLNRVKPDDRIEAFTPVLLLPIPPV